MSSLASADMQDRTGYDVLWPLGGPSADELKVRRLSDPPLEGKYHVVVYGGTNSNLKWQILVRFLPTVTRRCTLSFRPQTISSTHFMSTLYLAEAVRFPIASEYIFLCLPVICSGPFQEI